MNIIYLPDSVTSKAAKDALEYQDACNGTGVLHSLSRHFTAMRSESMYTGINEQGEATNYKLDTDTCNQHPVMILFLDKLTSLANIKDNSESWQDVDLALDACNLLADGKSAEWTIVRP